MKKLLQKIERELSLIKDKKERIIQSKRLKVLWEKYEGDDKIISSEELREEIEAEKEKDHLMIYTKIPALDRIIDGFREGNLVVVSAPTKMGKTTLCQTFTIEFAKQDMNCLWFSYEVPMYEFMNKFGDNPPLFYLPKQLKGNTMTWLEERIVESIAKFNTKVVFIDHLHYIVDMNARNQNMSLQIGSVMRFLKKIALKYNIVIFIVAHMKHIKLTSEPDLDDLRDSSFIGQEADIVLMMWRLKISDTEMSNEANLVVRAHRRTGENGLIKLIHTKGRFNQLQKDDNNTQ